MIETYSFGSMKVLGQTHHNDLKIIENQVIPEWWRTQGHVLSLKDIADILDAPIDVLVVGTGAYGAMRVPTDVTEAVSRRGIELVSAPTGEAVTAFNKLRTQGKRVAGAFHLTC